MSEQLAIASSPRRRASQDSATYGSCPPLYYWGKDIYMYGLTLAIRLTHSVPFYARKPTQKATPRRANGVDAHVVRRAARSISIRCEFRQPYPFSVQTGRRPMGAARGFSPLICH